MVRFDYHSKVPGERERAGGTLRTASAASMNCCYGDLAEKGLLHILPVIRDCSMDEGSKYWAAR